MIFSRTLTVPAFTCILLICLVAFLPKSIAQTQPHHGNNELTKQVLEIFEKKCQECHHPDTDDQIPYLHEKSNVSELLKDEDSGLVPGNPEESELYKLIVRDKASKKRMPKSKGAPGDETWKEPLDDEEKEIFRKWIQTLKASDDTNPATEKKDLSKKDGPQPKKETLASAATPQGQVPKHASLETQARFIFSEQCMECHDPNDHNPPDFSLPLPDFIAKNSPNQKSLAEEILSRVELPVGHDEKMPEAPSKPLSSSEINILKKWFASGEDHRVKREQIYYTDMLRTIKSDVREATAGAAKYYRYLTLTNLYNVAEADGFAVHSDREMDTFRAAISKLINSLSMGAKIVTPVAIDEEKTIYRIDLRDYKWGEADWERIVYYYPHGLLGVDARSEKFIYEETGSRMAYLRADWFTFAAAQPPLYDDIMDYLLGIYSKSHHGVQQRLEDRLGVDRLGNLREGQAIRAGFFESGVSDHNRLIERHESNYGSYWVSYDFKHRGASYLQDLRKAPLGPWEARLTDNRDLAFEHDGGEMIYSLPNGMQAYMLTTADGTRIDRAPTDIVRTGKGDGAIINGISCINCHDQGLKAAVKIDPMLSAMEDQVAASVEKSHILGGRELGLFRDLYADKPTLQQALMRDYERYKVANDAALKGIESAGEPITKLYDSYHLTRINDRRLAAEFGIDYEEMMELLKEESFSSTGFRVVYQSLENGDAESRQQLMQEYLQIAYVLKYHLLPFEPLGYEEFQGEVFAEKIRTDPLFVKMFGDLSHAHKKSFADLANDAKNIKVAITSGSVAHKAQAANSVLLSGGGKLSVSADAQVAIGHHGNLSLWANRDLYLQILLLSADGKVTQFFPNEANADSKVPFSKWPGRPFTIPFKATANWDGSTGTEYFRIYASEAPFTIRAKGKTSGGFQVFKRSQLFSSRGAIALKAGFRNGVNHKPSLQKKNHRIYETRVGFILKK